MNNNLNDDLRRRWLGWGRDVGDDYHLDLDITTL
jgi:hypothetical protein